MIRNLQKVLETSEKYSQERNRVPQQNAIADEKNKNSVDWPNTRMEEKEQKSVNLKIEQQKLPNLNKRELKIK